jgi:hypothetical protein
VIAAARCRTKTELDADARRVLIERDDDRWTIQPVQNRGPRRAWYVDLGADPAVQLRRPSAKALTAALFEALHHFDGRPVEPPKRRR